MFISTDWYSDVGGRANNEDAVGVFERNGTTLCVVADGLGGHDNGEVASNVVLKVVANYAYGNLSKTALYNATQRANEEILRRAGNSQMKTTLALLWMQNGNALVGTAGDTRIYQFRAGRIKFQSVDHTLAQLDVIAGDEAAGDVRKNPDRNKLIRVVGMKEGFKVDISELQYQPGDAFLLCSDGFWENILEDDMLRTLSQSKSAADWLKAMRRILEPRLNKDSDNNSAIAVVVR